MMVIPYLCGLCASVKAYDQFRLIHVLLNTVASAGSFWLAWTATSVVVVEGVGVGKENNVATSWLVQTLLVRGAASLIMAFGFLLLTPMLLAKSLEDVEVRNEDRFVRLGGEEEEEEEEEEQEKEEDGGMCESERKEIEMIENKINESSSSRAVIETVGNSVESACTSSEMTLILKKQWWVERWVKIFVMVTAAFTVLAILQTSVNGLTGTTTTRNHTKGRREWQDSWQESRHHNTRSQRLRQMQSKPIIHNRNDRGVSPELLGYGFIFHITFLLPMFTLHGLRTGTLMTLRVGACFALSVAVVIPFVGFFRTPLEGLAWSMKDLTLSLFAWVCGVFAWILFLSGAAYYFYLSSVAKAKATSVSNSSSSFFKVFGRERKR